MNERIQELLKQVGGIQHDEDGDELTPILVGKDLTKFAELIVRECIEIAKSTDPSDGDDYRSGRYWAGHDIKKHFGVEE